MYVQIRISNTAISRNVQSYGRDSKLKSHRCHQLHRFTTGTVAVVAFLSRGRRISIRAYVYVFIVDHMRKSNILQDLKHSIDSIVSAKHYKYTQL